MRLLNSLLGATVIIFATATVLTAQTIPIDSSDQLKLVNVKAESVTFKGRKALRVRDVAPPDFGDEGRLAILPKTDFQDGVIEVDLAVSASRSALRRINLVSSAFTCGRRMDARTIRCDAIIRFSIFRCPAFPGTFCERSFRRSTRATWISSRVSGPG